VSSSPWVRSLDDPAAADRAVAGGKGAALVRLRAAGLPVPAGFVVVSAASLDRPLGAAVPAEVAAAVAAGYAELGADPLVAVRSSGVSEDSERASAAGLLRTELGVRGVPDVLAAVARCWDSGSGPALQQYLRRHGGPAGAAVAVVVQVLVPARAAGVAMTRHPVSGDPEVVVVEATPGLGAPAAEGRVVPEHLEVGRADGRTRWRRPGRRDLVLVVADGEVRERRVDPAGADRSVLNDAEAAAVAGQALRVEDVLGCPADVEWALAADSAEVLVLQGRPMTGRLSPR
jgi:pyruvate,water dikinase